MPGMLDKNWMVEVNTAGKSFWRNDMQHPSGPVPGHVQRVKKARPEGGTFALHILHGAQAKFDVGRHDVVTHHARAHPHDAQRHAWRKLVRERLS